MDEKIAEDVLLSSPKEFATFHKAFYGRLVGLLAAGK